MGGTPEEGTWEGRERIEVEIIEPACELIYEDLDWVIVRYRRADLDRLKRFSIYDTIK